MELTGEVTGEGIDSWNTVIFLYNSALKEVGTKLEILNDEFQHVHQYNPIEYIKSRIKSPESIVKKLKRYGYESTIDNMVNYVNDIAGIRIVCSFTSDIYRMAAMIGKQNDLTVVSIKSYFKHIFGSDGYASGYYTYLWAEVLDSDGFELFKEKGIFDPETARKFKENILEKGGSEDPMKLYVNFRGQEPTVDALLRGRGLEPVAAIDLQSKNGK